MKADMFRTVALFVALSATGVCMVVLGELGGEDTIRRVLSPIGSAMFAAALAFFLIEMFALKRKVES